MGLPIVQGTVPTADDFNLLQPRAHDGADVGDYLDGMRPMTALAQLTEYSGTATAVRMIVSENVLFYKRDDNDITSPANPDGSVLVDLLGRRWKRLQGDVTAEVLALRETVVQAAEEVLAAKEIVLGSQISGTVGFVVFADMTLAYPDKTVALVGNDPDHTKNTWYVKSGASGAGAWIPALSLLLAALTATSLTIGAVTINSQTAAGYLRATIDSYGRLQRGTKLDGSEYIDKMLARVLSADAATVTALTISRLLIGPITSMAETWSAKSRAKTDAFGRMSYWEQDDGSIGISKLRDGAGQLVYSQLLVIKATADTALTAAASGGASDFRRTMVAAQSAWGQYPRPSLAVPPTLTLSAANPAAPADTTLTAWNAAGKWRTTGGFTSQYGANSYLQWKSSSPNGNAGGMTRAGGTSLETVQTGTAISIRLRGAGGPLRVLVGDAQGKHLAYVSKAFITPPSDGNAYQLLIDWGAVSATRTVVIEGNGAFQFGGIYVKTGESITAPAGVKPLVCAMGSSITEMDNSWARWLGYLLGADVYNVGVGSSGIVNPGVAPKVKQIDRSNDFTVGAFLLGIEEAGVNDSGDASYSAPTYAAVMGEFAAAYRLVLDAWFTAHPASPFIAWGPFWPNDAPTANIYRIRDAKQRVCSEYPLAFYVDTLQPGNIIKGNPIAGTYPATDYFAPYVASPASDTTHPIEPGSEFLGQAIFSPVDCLIRTRF